MEPTPFRRPCSRWSHHLKPEGSGLFIWLALILGLFLPCNPTIEFDDLGIAAEEVKNWALKFGIEASGGCAVATCVQKITQNFNVNGATAKWVDATQMLDDMRNEVQNMMAWKTSAIRKIQDVAELAVMKHTYDPEIKIEYYNAKKVWDPRNKKEQEMYDAMKDKEKEGWKPMEPNLHKNYDGTAVNTHHSIVHVPTNVYDEAPDVLNAIKWSEDLNPTFKNNLNFDPSLIWQFFGSATGFLRLFPAVKWKVPEGPDMYDCRMRPWYIQGAASAKDIVILLDGSGSMTGLRKEIARNVVLNILETLSDNDFVTILRFSEHVESVVPCFNNTLVQATERNLREFRELLKDLNTINIANFTLGLITAFELLQKVARNNEGSQCNQAIMLITDGAPYTYETIFAQYNWPNIPVRVFTYLIGREVTDMDEVQWMACYNRGYYTHVTTLAEVREQVQKYIPVMSRPVVLSGEHPIVWSSVYADVSDVKLSDWLWQERERAKMRILLSKVREKRQKGDENLMPEYPEGNISAAHYVGLPPDDFVDTPEPKPTTEKTPSTTPTMTKKKAVQLLTTVATPVFDRRNFSNITERIRSSKNIWIEKTKEMRVANILGVAGTDVPIKEIIKFTPPYKLGVNGYSYVVTNNGFVLYHPDLRPLFQDMLKPEYSTVDMAELELVDDDSLGPREFAEELLRMRGSIINRTIGWKTVPIKLHLDGLKRVVTRNMSFYYGPINKTPFSLVIALPNPYGLYRIYGQLQVKPNSKTDDFHSFFHGENWRVHPDWVYCDTLKNDGYPPLSPEDLIRKFLNISTLPQRVKWRNPSTQPVKLVQNEELLCDKNLIQSLLFDAKATNVDVNACQVALDTVKKIEFHSREPMIQMHGIVTTFVATRSGLLRFYDYRSKEEKENNNTERPFFETNTRATDELFYRRAVDFYYVNSTAFVFAVPFDAGTRNTSLVTASQAIFLGKGSEVAPVAVVGVQFRHEVFVERFFNTTGTCVGGCKLHKCTDDEMDCWLLDSNGYIIVSEIHEQTGKFFGEIDNVLFESMVHGNIYKKVRLYDYQAICIDILAPSGPASFLRTPLRQLGTIAYWLWSKIIMLIVQTNIFPWLKEQFVEASDDYYSSSGNDEENIVLNKTKPRPCDKEFYAYEMKPPETWEPTKGKLPNCDATGCDKNYIFQRIPFTNLVMLVTYRVDNGCSCNSRSESLEAEEVIYGEDEKCERMKNGTFRKLPEPCVHHHPEEESIRQQCGLGSLLRASMYLVVGALLLCLL